MIDLTREQMLDAFQNLWTKEFGELKLNVNMSLTGPACHTAIVKTDSKDGPEWRVDWDTIDDAIDGVLLAVYITLIQRKPKPVTYPFDDMNAEERVLKLLAAIDAR